MGERPSRLLWKKITLICLLKSVVITMKNIIFTTRNLKQVPITYLSEVKTSPKYALRYNWYK